MVRQSESEKAMFIKMLTTTIPVSWVGNETMTGRVVAARSDRRLQVVWDNFHHSGWFKKGELRCVKNAARRIFKAMAAAR